jgi:transposase-like protein
MSEKKEKQRRRRYSERFKRQVVGRMRKCKNIAALGRELGLDVKMMYQWKWKQEGRPTRKPQPLTTQAAEQGSLETLRRENAHLKRVLAEKALEVDFFKGALQQVEARRQGRSDCGATPSTRTSVSGRSPGKAN